MNSKKTLNILVLAGGPDKEHDVSIQSGREVAAGLKTAGHNVWIRDINPQNLDPLDEFKQLGGHVIFPALHGPWGEGGELQQILDSRNLKYVGCKSPAAKLCMDKQKSKQLFMQQNLPTPQFQVLADDQPLSLPAPLVIKPVSQGSSIDILICNDQNSVTLGRKKLAGRYPKLMYEQFIPGRELTVGLLDSIDSPTLQTLPVIEIVSQTPFYDYQAKYQRDDTQYLFDSDISPSIITKVQQLAAQAHHALGCRHMSRADFILDNSNNPWLLEVNTIPGFTSHSLLPKAAKHADITWPQLVDRLVRLAY